MKAPIKKDSSSTPSGTPTPIPILLAFERPWLALEVGVVAGSELVLVAEGVEDSDSDSDSVSVVLAKLYETGDGSLVYLFDTPKRALVMLLPYDSSSAVNGCSLNLQPLST